MEGSLKHSSHCNSSGNWFGQGSLLWVTQQSQLDNQRTCEGMNFGSLGGCQCSKPKHASESIIGKTSNHRNDTCHVEGHFGTEDNSIEDFIRLRVGFFEKRDETSRVGDNC